MKFVVDASVGFKTLVTEGDSDRVLALLGENLHAPDFYPVEVTSAVRIAETRQRITDALALLGDFLIYLPTLHSSLSLLPRAVEISRQIHRNSVYDCLYVALAEQLNCELVTADAKLFNAVRSEFPFVVSLDSIQP